MKTRMITLILVVGLAMTARAQYFAKKDEHKGNAGLFGRGWVSDEVYYGSAFAQQGISLPGLPGHDLEGDQPAPIGSGAALLLGLGSAYLLMEKRKTKQ